MYESSTLTTVLLGASVTLVAYIIWYFHNTFQYWKRRGIPDIKPTIFPFGNTLNLYLGKQTFGEVFSNAYLEFKRRGEKHGGIYYMNRPVYIPVDPEIIKKIIISDAHYFPNHSMYISPKDDILSGHLFNMEDKEWKILRTKTPSIFTSAKMRKMYLIMQRMVDPYKEWLDKFCETQEAVDIKSVVSRFTTDIICACAFGIDTNTLKLQNEELLQHARMFFDYQWKLSKNTAVMALPRNFLRAIKFRIFPKSTEKYVLEMFTDIFNYRKENNIFRNDLTDTLMRLTEKNEDEKDYTGENVIEPMDLKEFSCQMFLFLCAGFETSSTTQTFALYELAKNPDVQSKLRSEINRVLAKHDNKLTYDALMDMKYLEHCVDEALRIYPIFPILGRGCKEDYPIPGTDFTLEKGTFVMVTNMGIQRDPEYYPNPLQFDPERWTYENSLNRPFVANMPFGEGPRICVGKRFGLLQTKLGLATLIKDYEVSLSDKTTKGFKFVSSQLILRKEGDIWVNLKKVNS
ncbi:cytochrome P450 6a8-like [Diabrotica virgifera virgifera]|uniref:Cytochrome P450 n=1 Tax=Diabrotica virgifera virgifera TaxID=50390 RepID=A0ABM5KE84_DIAVI|nr:cytochrome P450 6a8-like [Diabrotica virgifera virgifera]